MIRIAVTGACGKMGRVITGLCAEREDCEIVAGIDKAGNKYDSFPVYSSIFDLTVKPDVIIDFSHPSALDYLLSYCKMNNVPAVIATTGYTDEQRTQITAASAQIPIFFTFNMSLGINLLVELARKATQILGGQFDIEILEKHHNLKHAVRGGTIVGEHDIIFAGHDEVITLSHSAQSKEVFAVGSVNAAVFLAGKPAGMYTMSDLIKEN